MSKGRVATTAGQRLKGMRELMGLSRPQFCEITGMEYNRLCNIENGKQRMHDVDFEKVVREFPHFVMWLNVAGGIDLDALEASMDKLLKFSAMRLRTGTVPEGLGFEQYKEGGDDTGSEGDASKEGNGDEIQN